MRSFRNECSVGVSKTSQQLRAHRAHPNNFEYNFEHDYAPQTSMTASQWLAMIFIVMNVKHIVAIDEGQPKHEHQMKPKGRAGKPKAG